MSECDREASIKRRPWLTWGCCAMENKINSIQCKYKLLAWPSFCNAIIDKGTGLSWT